jgi:hypothetical protein
VVEKRGLIMKRRVVRIGDRRFRVELPGGDVSEFSYREKPRRWDPDQCSYIDFEPGEDRYVLHWEGMFLDSFEKETDVFLFVLRFGYGISDECLVPSEILADFNLVYEAGDWVDEWNCPDQHEVIFALGEPKRPENRRIRFEGYPRITKKSAEPIEKTGWDNDRDQYYRAPLRVDIEIPVLDFSKLEEPKKRRREVPRSWSDLSNLEYELWVRHRPEKPDPHPEQSGVFSLKSGPEAEKAHLARKKAKTDLTE